MRRFWYTLDGPNVQRFVNLGAIVGVAAGAGLWVWDRLDIIAGGARIAIALLTATSAALIAIGAGYYALLFIRSRGWFGAPVRHIHHGELRSGVSSSATLEPTVTRGATTEPEAPRVRVGVMGNTAAEVWRRWLHLVVENDSPVIAHDARLRIRIDGLLEREWLWAGIREAVDLRAGTPVEIPIAMCDVAEPATPSFPSSLAYVHQHLPIGKWFITPEGHRNLGIPTYEIAAGNSGIDARWMFELTLTWTDGVRTQPPLISRFVLALPDPKTGREATLVPLSVPGGA